MKSIASIFDTNFVITEGSMVERLRRTPGVEIDPFVMHAGLIYSEQGRNILKDYYTRYIDIGKKYDIPFITMTPTWRANPERVANSKFKDYAENINQDGCRFVLDIKKSYGEYANSIWIAGLMACRGNAYKPQEALSRKQAARFHRQQAESLTSGGVDFIKAATLPAASEAMGIADAIAPLGIPYVLSFVVRPGGTLLDGTPLFEIIEQIDESVNPPPLFYMINCVHPSVFDSAMKETSSKSQHAASRIIGIQANTSALSPEELDTMEDLDTSEPDILAEQIVSLYQQYDLKILGGCCGTDDRHIEEIAKLLVK